MLDTAVLQAAIQAGVAVVVLFWMAHSLLSKHDKIQAKLLDHVEKEIERCNTDRAGLQERIDSLQDQIVKILRRLQPND